MLRKVKILLHKSKKFFFTVEAACKAHGYKPQPLKMREIALNGTGSK